jgi:hypothetical protein
MNKLILQLGMLAFCVAAVVFGSQRIALMETISRSFIVFMGVVIIMAVALTTMSYVTNKRHSREPESKPGHQENPLKTSHSGGTSHGKG